MAVGFFCLVVFLRSRHVFEIRARCAQQAAVAQGNQSPHKRGSRLLALCILQPWQQQQQNLNSRPFKTEIFHALGVPNQLGVRCGLVFRSPRVRMCDTYPMMMRSTAAALPGLHNTSYYNSSSYRLGVLLCVSRYIHKSSHQCTQIVKTNMIHTAVFICVFMCKL